MTNLEKNSYVLTTSGFKNINDINNLDYVYTSTKTIDRVLSTHDTEIKKLSDYSYIQNSIDDICFIIRNNKHLEVFDGNFTRYCKEVALIQKNDWLYHPWIQREQDVIINTVDLAKSTSNFYDSNYIYLFNNSILDISKELKIPHKAVEQTLICESKEYEQYFESIKNYIEEKFNIPYDSSDIENSFKDFKKFVKDKFVFKMKRYINVDIKYVSFVISVLKSCKINKTVLKDNSHLYELVFKYDSKLDKDLFINTSSFLTKIGTKTSITTEDNKTILKVFSKPLYEFVTNYLLINLNSIINSSKECQQFFVETLFNNETHFITNYNVALQLKELFLYYKQILGIKQYSNGYKIVKMRDDLDELESTLIIEKDGYYSRVIYKAPFDVLYTQYSSLNIKDKKLIHLGFTECRM